MKHNNKIWIVDAFTNKPFSGNPAAVMIVSDFPENAVSIAAELIFSETDFVNPLRDGRFHIRWFTPIVEVTLCGHATLASAHILFQENLVPDNQITFDSLSGPLHSKREKDGLVLDFPLQKTGKQLDTSVFASALKINQDNIIEAVESSDDVIVMLKNEDMVKQLSPDFAKIQQITTRALIVTAASKTYDCVSRFFSPRIGINEDPVTGDAHRKLAYFWSQKLQKMVLSAYQASPRGGILHLQVQGDRVFLKGEAVTVMEGIWKA